MNWLLSIVQLLAAALDFLTQQFAYKAGKYKERAGHLEGERDEAINAEKIRADLNSDDDSLLLPPSSR